jgi:hypothetical protein
MAAHDISDNLRGHKELVKGKVVDKQGVHISADDLEAKLLKVGSGEKIEDATAHTLAADAEEIDGQMVDKDGVHMSKDEVFASLLNKFAPRKQASKNNIEKTVNKTSANIDLGMYQPVFEELSKIPFSANFEQEMKTIAEAVKTAGMQFKVKKIIANTKTLAKNAQKFYYSDDNVRFIFSILGKKYSMAAQGDFHGNEALHVSVDGDELQGTVLRIKNDGDYTDVTSNYKIKIVEV